MFFLKRNKVSSLNVYDFWILVVCKILFCKLFNTKKMKIENESKPWQECSGANRTFYFLHEDDVMALVGSLENDAIKLRVMRRSLAVIDTILDLLANDFTPICPNHCGDWIKSWVPGHFFGDASIGPLVFDLLKEFLDLVLLPARLQELRCYVADHLSNMEDATYLQNGSPKRKRRRRGRH